MPTDRSTVPDRYSSSLARVPWAERDPDGRQLNAVVDHLGAVGIRDRSVIVVRPHLRDRLVRCAEHSTRPPGDGSASTTSNGPAVTTIKYTLDGSPRLVAFNDSGRLPHALA